MRFCPGCGTKLVQEPVIPSDIESSTEPRVSRGVQAESGSAALKWGTGILLVLAGNYLGTMIILIDLIRYGYELDMLGDFILVPLSLAAAVCAVKRKHWRFVVGVTVWLPIATIIGLIAAAANGQIGSGGLGDLASVVFWFLLEIACLILIVRTEAEFS